MTKLFWFVASTCKKTNPQPSSQYAQFLPLNSVGSEAYRKKGDYERALADVEEAIKLSADPNLLKEKANILWEMGKPSTSIRFLEECPASPEISSAIEQYKVQYKNECGLSYGDPTMTKIEKFMKWMRENGAKFGKIRMYYYGPDYRGVHSIKVISEEENFLWVPRKLVITAQMGKETVIGAKLIASGVKLSWDYLIYITIFLLVQEYDENSWWKPYMDVYPKTVDTFPMFFSEEEKEMLKGSPMYDQIKSEIAETKEEYKKIVAAVPEFKKFPFEAYLRNKTLTISRIFYVTINGVVENIMVPLAGILIINNPSQTCLTITTTKLAKLTGNMWMKSLPSLLKLNVKFLQEKLQHIPLHYNLLNQICENYGQKPNYRFLFYYGFLIENNKSNAVYLKVYFNPSDPYLKIKEKMLGATRDTYLKLCKFFESFATNAKYNNKLLGYLRFIEYEGDLNKIGKYFIPPIEDIKMCKFMERKLRMPAVSIENEKKMLSKLKIIAEKCLKKFPQSYDDDVKLLANSKDLSFNKRNCIIFRAGEKKIYRTMISMADIGLAVLNKSAKLSSIDLKGLAKSTPFGTYIQKSLIPLIGKWKQRRILLLLLPTILHYQQGQLIKRKLWIKKQRRRRSRRKKSHQEK
eukprot:TRINITY_DN64487_c1_g1_i1.p1 TRINITY_DN64487_c1_g1~~TRINITY_DN64487_c1_g1_i1.p1  ORF type:complete len:635 (-),score=66.34 TRINITY_DN64487_c1_g1_i1:833-2737(-)